MNRAEFAERFGCPDVTGALCGYTREDDTRAVLTLLLHARPSRVLEIGTALGHMTANLTRWMPEHSRVFTIALVRGILRAVPGAARPSSRLKCPAMPAPLRKGNCPVPQSTCSGRGSPFFIVCRLVICWPLRFQREGTSRSA